MNLIHFEGALLFYTTLQQDFNCDALRNLAPFSQFKKREKHPRRSVTFSKVDNKLDNNR